MKKKTELISLAELARLAGVARSSAYVWVTNQEQRGARLVRREGRRGAMVDKNNPLIKAYIDNKAAVLDNRSITSRKGISSSRNPDALRKMKNQLEKIELATAVQREKYITRSLAIAYLEEFMKQSELCFDRMVDNIVGDLNKEFKEFKNMDAGKTRKIREVLGRPVEDALIMTRREIDRFIKDTEPRHGKNTPLPVKK
jgi:hypothetical protein